MGKTVRKHTSWYVRPRGNFYALGPVRFMFPATAREARAWARDFLGVERFYGEVWPA